MYGYFAHMYFCAPCMPGVCGDQKRVPVPWNWSCGKLWVTMWRLGIKPRSFAWIMFWTTQTSFQALTIFLLKPLWFINKLLAKSKKKKYVKLAIKAKYRWHLLSTPKGSKDTLKFYLSVSNLFGFRMINWIKMHVNLLTYDCRDANYLCLVENCILCLCGRLTNFVSNSEIFFWYVFLSALTFYGASLQWYARFILSNLRFDFGKLS